MTNYTVIENVRNCDAKITHRVHVFGCSCPPPARMTDMIVNVGGKMAVDFFRFARISNAENGAGHFRYARCAK